MKSLLLVLIAFAISAAAHGDHHHSHDHDEGVHSEHVLNLTPETFDKSINEHDLTLVEFFAPWCGHCKSLAPEYAKAAEQLAGSTAALAAVDCIEHKELCNKYSVRGFPTIKLFRPGGKAPVDYDQARKADAIVGYMRKQSQPAFKELKTESDVNEFIKNRVAVVAFISAADVSTFGSIAEQFRSQDYVFAYVTDSNLISKFKAKTGTVRVYKTFDDAQVDYTGAFTSEGIVPFVKSAAFPLVGEIGPENYQQYLDRGFNFCWLFVENGAKTSDAAVEALSAVAKDHKTQLSFVKLDGVRYVDHAKHFGLSGKTPGLCIEDRATKKNYLFPEDQTPTTDAIRKWVEDYLGGRLVANVKSEPEPEDNSGPVKVVVGTNFERLVMDASKDVLVEFYAPWCGHCKSLAPKYEELGKNFADTPSVVIAKVDATANDTPADISGFPTLILYPASDKAHPVTYNGERTAEAIGSWLRRTASTLGGSHEGHDHDHDHDHDEL
jgi:protein disulfide-isomerase A1